MLHPNYLGTFQFFASLDSATGTVSFSESKRRDKDTLEAISTPLMLIVLAKECFEQLDGFIKRVADLQYSREQSPMVNLLRKIQAEMQATSEHSKFRRPIGKNSPVIRRRKVRGISETMRR
jgi:hypothetical protein